MLAVSALALVVAFSSSVPAEPGASVLFEGRVYQAVAADLDGDGSRELVALVEGDGGTIAARAWRDVDGAWREVGGPIEALPETAGREDVWRGWRVRLLVRAVSADGERVTLVSQPDLRSADEDGECCLRLEDLTLTADGLALAAVAPTRQAVEAVLVVDLDGDGTDEIVATRSVLPIGDVSYPTDTFVHRWSRDEFSVLEQRLPIGSGDTPFLLGDTDGVPGDELGIIATAGRPELHRIGLAPSGALRVDDAGTVATAAMGVPLGATRGAAVLHATGDLSVHAWPVGERLGPPSGSVREPEAVLLGVVDVEGTPRLIASRIGTDDRLRVFDLPDPAAPASRTVTTTAAALTLRDSPLDPYVGALPGGWADGHPAIVHAGRLMGGTSGLVGGIPFAALVGAQPVGLVGRNGEQIAIVHGMAAPRVMPFGGRLEPPAPPAEAAISVAPLAQAILPEADDGRWEPAVSGGAHAAEGGTILVDATGFVAEIEAPVGSRVYAGGGESVEATLVVPEGGRLDLPIAPPDGAGPGSPARVSLTITTPAGHSYLAGWDVELLDEPPSLSAAVRTPLGSSIVEVAGDAPSYASVTVAGEPVTLEADGRFLATIALPPWPTDLEIVATDPVGNTSVRTVSGVGWLDYRDLPWIPIVTVAIGVVAVVLFLRVPRSEPMVRRADDDAALEELEGD